jgi:hypothetical protein
MTGCGDAAPDSQGSPSGQTDGQGEFRRSDVRLEYREDTGVAVADFDGDGDQDIFTGRNEDSYDLWLNQGEGTFGG